MNKFYMMIGFPGSGKSTYAEKLSKEEDAIICSSDALRKELYGSEAVQEHNEEIFNILMQRVIKYLSEDKSVIYDAMNISSKYRRNTLKMLSRFNCEKIAYIIATPYEMCLDRNSIRDRHVPEHVIKKALMNFNVPSINEGFTRITTVYPDGFEFKSYIDILDKCFSVPHDNPHHSESIGRHMELAESCLLDRYEKQLALMNTDDRDLIEYATLLHDIGKPFTKVFKNFKGEDVTIAHYYNHENVGAYEVLLTNIPENLKLDVSLLIQYHMKFYNAWKQSNSALEKDKKFLGDRIFNLLEILHDCDISVSFPVV